MNDDPEVDWGNDEDDIMPSRPYFDSVGMEHTSGGVETDDVEDAVSLGGDEEEEFAAYGARSNEQNTPSDKFQTTHSKRDARRRSRTPRKEKEMSQYQPAPLPPSPQPESRQLTLTHALPPKPVVSSSIRPPPSTMAASPMSLPRKERRSNGNSTKKSDDASLSDKETKSSLTAGRESRHRDSNADESSWTRPSSNSNATDSQPPHRDRARGVNDRDVYPPVRREDDCYRPSYGPVYYSSDEEEREPNTCRTQPRHDARYRYDDRDRHYDYPSDDRVDKPPARSARRSPDDVSLDRSRSTYRESNESGPRRAHPRDRDASPIRDDSPRRVLRRDDYPVYDSYDKSSRDYGDSSRRNSGTAERPRYPESFSGRSKTVVLRDPHTQNQGPGRSSTLRRNSPSPRPRSRSPPYNGRDDRRHSPPRYQEYLSDTSRHSYRGRAESPQRFRDPNKLDRRDTPPDLPQRRPRGISDLHDPDYAPKRRKMDDDDGILPPVRRPVGVDTYIPLETSTASTSPRSTGALDDLSRQRRREPLPPQSHRYREASDLTSRPPLSGSNRIMPQPPVSTQPSHRHYPPSSRDNEVFPSRHSDPDLSRLDRSRNAGHGTGYVYVDKFSRDDHMKVDSPYPSRGPYGEHARPQDLPHRTSSHNDAISREPIPPPLLPRSRESINAAPATPIVLTSTIMEKSHRRSRDRSPRHHHESRQISSKPSLTSLSTTQTGAPQDTQLDEDHRHRGRRIDRDREDHSPTLQRHPSKPVAVRSLSTGRYDVPDGGPRSLRSPELHATPSIQEQPRHDGPISRRERQALLVAETNDVPPPRVGGDSLPMYDPPQERASRSGPPPDTDFLPPSSPPPPPAPPLTREWIPKPPEFMTNLPPPSTRLPGAPPPPVLPTHTYSATRDPSLHRRLPSQDEHASANHESESGRDPSQEKYKHKPSSPVRQTKDVLSLPPYQTQEGRHEQMPHKYTDRTSRIPARDGLKENSGGERYIPTLPEDSRTKVTSETIPASWDRPRDIASSSTRKPLTLPASLPPKPVAALGDLNLQSSSSLRAGHSSRSRRGQQQSTDETNSHRTRRGRGDGGRDKDREGNGWGPTSEYPGPSLLARMSNDLPGRDMTEIGKGSGETQRKRARRRYQGS